ncbi:methyltransferase domain-containing protein [Azospirillum melinis]|uniref:Methyltransferase domain-containing protein n=1 Tax=Azospirillum melinis TaxID=328839 RepID=A0ABX2KN26_9PROT|nr:class I SAM-dependent methyltransferase [Azospirillum melinis]MBP2309800.1 SAM-dependent methyltransferase [Azospirillum melinis]NUB04093.1 methyltransferase domain-containing protein [Azospirillum melinis]
MSVHHSSSGYETGAKAYVKGRPSYPAEAAVWLREVLGVGPGRKVLEVGAGTGKFIAVLKQCGGEITAVEPVAGMREQLVPAFPDVTVLAGNAESIPLPDGSVDAVVCAQAFHWFATAAALQEMRRVLKPGGRLGLIWNVRDERTSWVAALTAITAPREGDTPRYRTGDWRRVFPAPGFEAIDERHVPHAHVGSPDDVIVKRTMSVSFIAALPPEQQAEVERDVRALIAGTPELAGRAEIAFPYDTVMFAYRKV